MKKKILSFIIISILFFNVTAYAQESSIKSLDVVLENVVVEDYEQEAVSTITAISHNNNLYFSLMELAEKLDKKVVWNKEANIIDILQSNQSELDMNSNVIVSKSKLDINVELINFDEAVTAKGAIVVEDNINNIMFEKNGYTKLYPASTTKVMTALVALENGNLDDEVIVSSSVNKLPGDSRRAFIMPGDRLTLRQLLYGMLLHSGNDCAVAIAEHIGKSEKNFAAMMNKKAKEIGTTNTNFVNPHGYHDPNHYTTPRDLALIAIEASKHPEFIEIVKTPYYKAVFKNKNGKTKTKSWKTTNLFLRDGTGYQLEGIIGGKTGYTEAAGRCLVIISKYNGHDYFCAVLKDTSSQRYKDTKKLLQDAYSLREEKELQRHKSINTVNIQPTIYMNDLMINLDKDTFQVGDEIYTSLDNVKNIFKESNIFLSDTSIKVFIDTKLVNFKTMNPIIYKDNLMVSIEDLANEFNLSFNWDDKENRVLLYGHDIRIEIPIDEKKVTKNNREIELKESSIIINGNALVSIDFINCCFGKEVDWGKTKIIKIDEELKLSGNGSPDTF